jgi:flagella basal body P-ring formation protein FlgA
MIYRFLILLGLALPLSLQASDEVREYLKLKVRTQLLRTYPDSRILIRENWNLKDLKVSQIRRVEIQDVSTVRPARVRVEVEGVDGATTEWREGEMEIEALQTVWVPKARITPGENLSEERLELREVDLTSPEIRSYRGDLMSAKQFPRLEGLEARGTLLAGKPLLMSQTQVSPINRRGDRVVIHVSSGDVHLKTSGLLQEDAQIGSRVRVVTLNTKKELTGIVKSQGHMEVSIEKE